MRSGRAPHRSSILSGVTGRDGKLQVIAGMGQSIVMLPADIAATLALRHTHLQAALRDKLRVISVAYLTFPLIDTAATLVGFQLLFSLGMSRASAALGALGMLFLTSFLPYSQHHQENNLMLLCTLLVFLAASRWLSDGRSRWVALAATAAAFNLLIRLPTVLELPCVCLFVALAARKQPKPHPQLSRWKRQVLLIALPILLAGTSIDRLYQYHRFGSFFGTYTALWGREQRAANPSLRPGYPFSGSFAEGFAGPFISRRKSMFMYDPVLLLAIAAAICLRGGPNAQTRALLAAGFLQLLGYIAFHARLEFWHGDFAWGDRYITVPLDLLELVALGVTATAWPALRRMTRAAVAGLCSGALLVQCAAVVFPPGLELVQEMTIGGPMFLLGRRFLNIWLLITDRLADAPHPVPDQPAMFRVAFTPFNFPVSGMHGAHLILAVLWMIGVIAVAICTTWFVRKLTAENSPTQLNAATREQPTACLRQ